MSLDNLLSDVRQSLRALRKAPAFTLATILTLALGIGAMTIVFGVVYGVLLRPLPYAHADRIVEIVQVVRVNGGPARVGLQDDQLRALRASSRALSGLAFFGGNQSMTLTTGRQEPVRLVGAIVSPAVFETMAVQPEQGRAFRSEEELAGHESVVILSARALHRYFAGDSSIVDTAITLNGQPYRVVGVMPERFAFPEVSGTLLTDRLAAGELDTAPEFWLPHELGTPLRPGQGFTLRPMVGRLREGFTLDQAIAEANVLIPPLPGRDRGGFEMTSLQQEITRKIRPRLLLFQTAVAFILFIACVNVTNLLLARATYRRRELAIRSALGAGSLQLARRVVAETALVAVAGGALGCLLAFAVRPVLRALPPDIVPRLADIRLDLPVFVFAAMLSIVIGLVMGVFVSIRIVRANPWIWLREIAGSDPEQAPGRRNRPSHVLVVFEIAAATILLAGAGLLMNSFVRLSSVNPGFDPSGTVTFRLTLPPSRYSSHSAQASFYGQLQAALRGLPGVTAVSLGSSLPFQPAFIGMPLTIGERKGVPTTYRLVTPNFFRTFGIPLLAGREFSDADREGAVPAAVVNDAFVRRYFAGANPLGQQVQFLGIQTLEIVGVVADSRLERLSAEYQPEINLTYARPLRERFAPLGTVAGAVRTADDPMRLVPAIRRSVRDLDPLLAVYDVAPMSRVVSNSYLESRLYSGTAAAVALCALLLAGIGLYGLMNYSVASRTRELAIRIALGADSAAVVRSVVIRGAMLTLVGQAIGLAGAFLVNGFLKKLLFGIAPEDPGTLVSAVLLFVMVSGVACYVPARRATRIDPVAALNTV